MKPGSLGKFAIVSLLCLPALVLGQNEQPSQDEDDFVRYVDGAASQALETAVVRFERGSETVDLVSVVHLADADYFDQLNALLRQYDAVLYEMVGGRYEDRPENLEAMSDSPEMNGLQAAHGLIQTLLDMEYQIDGIDYTAINFYHADVDWDQYAELMASRNQSLATVFQRALFAASTGEEIPGIPTDEQGANDMIGGMFNAFASGDTAALKNTLAPILGGAEGLIQKIEGEDGTVLITERNKVVMRHVQKHRDNGNEKIAIFYGAGHMPDLAKRLEALGFQRGAESWMTAWDIQPTPEAEKLTPLQRTDRDEQLAGAIFNVFKSFMEMMPKEPQKNE